MLQKVGVLVVDGLAMFEFGVICEVFGVDRTDDGVPLFDFRVCGAHPGRPLRTGAGVTLTPARGLRDLDDVDLVCVPASTIRHGHDPAVLSSLRRAHARGATILSVCSGAFLLAEAGLLDGRTATTHWRHADALAESYPEVIVDPDVLFVDEGSIITSAGTAAGIDACLHLVRRELGSAIANTIARRMVVPPQRDGGQRQYIPQPLPMCADDSLRDLLEWVVDHLDYPHTVESLASRALTSPRTLARRFSTETGSTPMRWITVQRIQGAQHFLEESDLGMETIARRCGLGSAALLRHHFRQVVGVSPTEYRAAFRTSPGKPTQEGRFSDPRRESA